MKTNYRKEIEVKQNGIFYDPDSSPNAWKHYRRFYTVEHWNILNEFDLINVDTYNNIYNARYKEGKYKRLLSPIKVTSKYADEGRFWSRFNFGGDTDFNFNSKKFKMFRSILDNDNDAILLLENCKSHHYSLVNFSLMPGTGSLNIYKGKNRFDRIDTFIKDLHNYFLSISIDVLSEAGKNTKPLNNFLSTFRDIYEYAEKVYFIRDKEFIDRVIIEGSLPIETKEDVVRYMKLANDFWEKKEDYFLSKKIC